MLREKLGAASQMVCRDKAVQKQSRKLRQGQGNDLENKNPHYDYRDDYNVGWIYYDERRSRGQDNFVRSLGVPCAVFRVQSQDSQVRAK